MKLYRSLLAACLLCAGSTLALAHQPMPVWNIDSLAAELSKEMWQGQAELVAFNRERIATARLRIDHPEQLDTECLAKESASECRAWNIRQKADYEDKMKKAQADFDAGPTPIALNIVMTETSARDYLRIHWAEFTDANIVQCVAYSTDWKGMEHPEILMSYDLLKFCLGNLK